jgi:uncharacterized transporter YbjL
MNDSERLKNAWNEFKEAVWAERKSWIPFVVGVCVGVLVGAIAVHLSI